MNQVEKFEKDQITKLTENKIIPDFASGDTIKVHLKIVEGTTERVQIFEGIVIARNNKGLSSSVLVRKISSGEGVERRFMIYSPNIVKIELVKSGVVRRAKLYYLRSLQGKAARIKEKVRN